MGISDMRFSVKVIDSVVVGAKEPWNDQWLPFTNLDLLVPPLDVGSFFCYHKPSHGSFPTMLNTLKASLSRALTLFYPLAGDIAWNAADRENQIHCNNQGVDFIQAFADVQLKELNFYDLDESIEGKLMPKKLRGVCAIQVTELKCGGMVIGIMFDHRIADGYSSNMFISSWADIARSETPSMLPSFQKSILNPRNPSTHSSSIDSNLFAHYDHRNRNDGPDDRIINRLYYIEGAQLNKIQSLASENGSRRSKLEAFTSFLWKTVAMSMEDLGNHNEMCTITLPVEGRRWLSEGDGEEKQKLMASHFGNVLSLPFGTKGSQELKEMSLTNIATEVHEFLQPVTRKDHFLDVIDWVEEHRSDPMVLPRALANKEMTVIVSSGQRFQFTDKMDFGCGKLAFGSCHLPPSRKDSYVMTLASPTNNEDWIVYMHMQIKHMNYIEAHASHIFKPLNADYLRI
ncbi:rosmarinate synthase-like [Cynara cardunculus var. scolymus]|uniref:Chloramphenicol acetyltransferase-like domain-containing protein n=1 Tax=Cynara cardunculus var. scolymus TaxID=59895 RepID=A0A118JYQ5_CYNCS|nr:rosmarinate synthase-like [Cynara cardunculus var. scolymus]KVH97480.1 Chloramphenicol acetyltransferase-like domain-containing protein [Cynara cardunculus var. scolymus]